MARMALQQCALGAALALLGVHTAQARHLRHHAAAPKTPPVISYVGGKNPHATVALVWDFQNPPHVFRLRTPRGWVTVRWREDSGVEDGGPWPMDGEISHPDIVDHIVVLSPPSLPVYLRGAGGAKWAHLNGNRVPATKLGDSWHSYPADPFRMEGGLNVVAVAYPDPE